MIMLSWESTCGAATGSRELLQSPSLDGPSVQQRPVTSNSALPAPCRMLRHLGLPDDQNYIFHGVRAMGSNHRHAFFSFTSLLSSQPDGFRVRYSRVWHLTCADHPFFTLCQSKGWACCRNMFALHRKYSHPVGSRVNQKEFCGSEAPTQPRDWECVQKNGILNATIPKQLKCKNYFSYLLMEETPWNTLSLCGLSLQSQAEQMSWYKAPFW